VKENNNLLIRFIEQELSIHPEKIKNHNGIDIVNINIVPCVFFFSKKLNSSKVIIK